MVDVVTPDGKEKHEEWRWIAETTRGASTLQGSSVLTILVDGIREDNYDLIMEMPAAEIESVQLLRPWQTLAYTFGAINGAILVKTRSYNRREPLSSKGAMYTPTGLSPMSYPYKEIALPAMKCSNPGRYRLLVDVITDEGIRSYERTFNVVE